jgi:hypothetical protein
MHVLMRSSSSSSRGGACSSYGTAATATAFAFDASNTCQSSGKKQLHVQVMPQRHVLRLQQYPLAVLLHTCIAQ